MRFDQSIQLCDDHCHQHTEQFHHQKVPWCPFAVSAFTPSLAMLDFIFSKVSYICNHTRCHFCVCTLTLHHASENHPCGWVCQWFVPFWCWVVFHGKNGTVCWSIQQLMDLFGCLQCGLLWVKPLHTFEYNLLGEQSFHFSWVFTSLLGGRLLDCLLTVYV